MPTHQRNTQNRDKDAETKRRPPKKKRSAAAPAQAAPQPSGDDRYSPSTWGSGTEFGGAHDLTMPSGQVALVRRPGVEQLMVEGVLHNLDNLSALVDKKFIKKPAGANGQKPVIDTLGLAKDPAALQNVMHTVDRVVCAVVLKPSVTMTPADITRRQPGVIYADMIAIEDRMFIFNWSVGGTKDLESFRRESEAALGSLSDGVALEEVAE